MSQLYDDLIAVRALMADPDSVVLDRGATFEDASGGRVAKIGDLADIPDGTARGCLLGNIARVTGDFTARYEATQDAIGPEALRAFMTKDDRRCLAIIDKAIKDAA